MESKLSAVLILNVLLASMILDCESVIGPFPKGKRGVQEEGKLDSITVSIFDEKVKLRG